MTFIGTADVDLRDAQEASRGSSSRDGPPRPDRGGRTPGAGGLAPVAAQRHGRSVLAVGACLVVLAGSALAEARTDVLTSPSATTSGQGQAQAQVPAERARTPRSLTPDRLFGALPFMAGLGAILVGPAQRAAAAVPPTAVLTPVPALVRPGAPAFTHPLGGTATYFPLVAGTRYTYEGTVTDADGTHRHRLVFVVTDLVKRVDGMDARVILDRDYSDGVLTESELAFFAQDDAGNVWTRGEYPEEYEDGAFVGAPSTWVTGVRGARAGILVPGTAAPGTPPFVQGRAPAVGFHDVGQVVATGLRVCVPTGCYSGVVEVKESAPNAPDDGIQLKYYAPRVGGVRIAAQGGDSREVMVLRSLARLGARDLQVARTEALRLDRRGYTVSKDYRATGRAHLAG